tara:strand:+ start:934 stop:1170 length:237 start_codon:yes stop_codon:yes gene_type:complete
MAVRNTSFQSLVKPNETILYFFKRFLLDFSVCDLLCSNDFSLDKSSRDLDDMKYPVKFIASNNICQIAKHKKPYLKII